MVSEQHLLACIKNLLSTYFFTMYIYIHVYIWSSTKQWLLDHLSGIRAFTCDTLFFFHILCWSFGFLVCVYFNVLEAEYTNSNECGLQYFQQSLAYFLMLFLLFFFNIFHLNYFDFEKFHGNDHGTNALYTVTYYLHIQWKSHTNVLIQRDIRNFQTQPVL